MNIFQKLTKQLEASGTTLVAVSKNQPLERIMELYDQGQRIFGENRVQELVPKYEALPKDIEWHLIGHLQTNKVRQVVPFVRLIHSVDSFHVLAEIDKEARKCGRVQDCLLQFHVANEETKFGFLPDGAWAMMRSPEFWDMKNIRIRGIMGMATQTTSKNILQLEFRLLKKIFTRVQEDFFPDDPHFDTASLGMSSDWQVAVEQGSTMVRIGSLLFP